jgi:hypothetical protein
MGHRIFYSLAIYYSVIFQFCGDVGRFIQKPYAGFKLWPREFRIHIYWFKLVLFHLFRPQHTHPQAQTINAYIQAFLQSTSKENKSNCILCLRKYTIRRLTLKWIYYSGSLKSAHYFEEYNIRSLTLKSCLPWSRGSQMEAIYTILSKFFFPIYNFNTVFDSDF